MGKQGVRLTVFRKNRLDREAKAKKKSESKGRAVRFIQRAKVKVGALSKQLGIRIKDNIPFALLELINRTPVGVVIKNPTSKGKKRIMVTRLLKQRSVFAFNLKNIRRG